MAKCCAGRERLIVVMCDELGLLCIVGGGHERAHNLLGEMRPTRLHRAKGRGDWHAAEPEVCTHLEMQLPLANKIAPQALSGCS
jgi:hypothetical protein